jgi:hypothetical protein
MKVVTTQNTGLSIEHWADRCLSKIIQVSDNSDSLIKDQAIAFKADIRHVLIHYMSNAIKSDRTTLYNLFVNQGHKDMAEILRRL